MGNNDIGLLKYCFSVFSQKNRRDTAEIITKMTECLRKAGALSIKEDCEKGEISFCIRNNSPHDSKADQVAYFRYKIKMLSGGRQITLEQEPFVQEAVGAHNLILWYAKRRNEILSKGMRYALSPVHLETRMLLRNNWETDVIRAISNMNHVIMEDYEIFESLNRGDVPDEIKTQIRQEYREYEREISHGDSV